MIELSFRINSLSAIISHYYDIFKYYFRFLSAFTPNIPPIAPLMAEIASFIPAAAPIWELNIIDVISAIANITAPQRAPVSIPRRLKLFAAINPDKNEASIKSPAENGFISANGISFFVITNEKSSSMTDDTASPTATAFNITKNAE